MERKRGQHCFCSQVACHQATCLKGDARGVWLLLRPGCLLSSHMPESHMPHKQCKKAMQESM
eukprot:1143942-Pelagomonas_calceolata.AAC.11